MLGASLVGAAVNRFNLCDVTTGAGPRENPSARGLPGRGRPGGWPHLTIGTRGGATASPGGSENEAICNLGPCRRPAIP